MFYEWRGKMVWIGQTSSGISRTKLRQQQKIDTILYSILDPGAKEHIAAARAEGFSTGVYSDPHWFDMAKDGFALKYRQKIDELVAAVGLKSGDHLQTDAELVSLAYLHNLFIGSPGNRGLFASSNSEKPIGTQADKKPSYTNMPFQNHTVVDFTAIAQVGAHWFYQLYYGAMEPADGNGIVLEILRDMAAWAGKNWAEYTHPFYDAAHAPSDARDGAFFTAERFPTIFTAKQLKSVRKKAAAASLTKDQLREHYREIGTSL